MTFDDEVINMVLTSNDSKFFDSKDHQTKIGLLSEKKEENNPETLIQNISTINLSNGSFSKVNPSKKRIKKKSFRKSKPKSIEIKISHNKVKKISHKAKSNFLNDFESELEQSQAKNSSEKFISNFDIFQLRSSTSLKENSTYNLSNIFQANNSSYSKLLPWEKSSKVKRLPYCKNKSTISNSTSKTKSNGLKFKEVASKYNSFITIYDLSYRSRDQNSNKSSNDFKMYLLGDSEKISLDKKDNRFTSDTSKDFENAHIQKLDNSVLNDNSLKTNIVDYNRDIISRVLKSNIPVFKADLK